MWQTDPANVQITANFGGEVYPNLVENQYLFIPGKIWKIVATQKFHQLSSKEQQQLQKNQQDITHKHISDPISYQGRLLPLAT